MIRNICRKNHMQNESDWRQFSPRTLFFQSSNNSAVPLAACKASRRLEVWDPHLPGELHARVMSTNRLQQSQRNHGIFCCSFFLTSELKGFSPWASWWTAGTTPIFVLGPCPKGLCMCTAAVSWSNPGGSWLTQGQWQLWTLISFQNLHYWISWNPQQICNCRNWGAESRGAPVPPRASSGWYAWTQCLCRGKAQVPRFGWLYWDISAPMGAQGSNTPGGLTPSPEIREDSPYLLPGMHDKCSSASNFPSSLSSTDEQMQIFSHGPLTHYLLATIKFPAWITAIRQATLTMSR